jgi:hypothetical protein
MNENDIDDMSEEQVRDLLRKIVESLNLAQEDGVFGKESWQGYLEIEI